MNWVSGRSLKSESSHSPTSSVCLDNPMKKSAYRKFLESKVIVAERTGFDGSRSDIHRKCFPHQKDAIQWAVGLGRALIAMSFGLGKTRIQCEIARLVHAETAKKFLVICPLGVKHQFVNEDGPVLGVQW